MTLSREVHEEAQTLCEKGLYTEARSVVELAGGVWPQDFFEDGESSQADRTKDSYRHPQPRGLRQKYRVRRSKVQKHFDKYFNLACETQEKKRDQGT